MSDVLGWAGLGTSVAALTISGVALALTRRQVGIDERLLDLEEQQHAQRQVEAAARAELAVTVKWPHADGDGVIPIDGTAATMRVWIRVTNKGDKAATSTTLNVLIPALAERPRWCGPLGEMLPGSESPISSDEKLQLADGTVVGAWDIGTEIGVVPSSVDIVRQRHIAFQILTPPTELRWPIVVISRSPDAKDGGVRESFVMTVRPKD